MFKTSFSIRNLKRSTIKEFYAKEELKRKSYATYQQNSPNQQNTLNSIDSNLSSHKRIWIFYENFNNLYLNKIIKTAQHEYSWTRPWPVFYRTQM